MAGLHFAFTADNGNFMRALHEVTAGVRDASRQIEADGGSIDKTISRIKTGLATLGVGLGFKEITSAIANTRGEFQQLDVAFKTILGSEEKATALMSQLIRTAAITPFGLQEVATGAKQLLAFGMEADKVNKTLTQLGDISAGLGANLGDLVYLYGTTMAQGRLYTQDLNQFTGRGIPMIGELAKQFGVAENKVKELVEAGKVGFPEVQKVIESLTGEGSKFDGLMEEQSKTISGQISNIEDAFDTMLNDIGKSQQGLISGTLDVTSTLIENWQTVLGILGSITAAYSVQKAILALDTGFTKAATNYGYDAEIEQLKALIPLKEEEQKTALQQAVASGNLTEAKAAEVAALREEAQAQLEALTAKETAAKAEAASTAEKVEAINEEILGIQSLKESLLEQYTAATNAGDAEKAQALATDIASAETWLKEEASLAAAAAEEAKTAATNAAAASEARETLATQINTAQTTGNTAATGVLTIAKEKLAVAIGKVNAMIEANKFAILTGAVVALGYAVYKLVNYESDLEKATQSAEKAASSQEQSMRKEQSTLDDLKKSLENAKKGSDEWKSAKEQIVSQFGKYHNGLDTEIEKTGTLASTYDRLTKSIRLSAAARAMEQYRSENDISEDIDSYLESIRSNLERGVLRRNQNGELKKTAIVGDLRESIMQKAYEYIQNGDKNIFSDKEWEILNQTGAFYRDPSRKMSQSATDRLRALINLNKKGEEIIAQRYGTSIDEIDGRTIESETKAETQDKVYWESKKKDAISRLEALTDIAAKGKEGDKIRQEIAEYNKRLTSFDDGSKKKSDATASQLEAKEENAAGKLADILRKQAEERLRIEQDYEYERWQSRINLMQEGEAKVLAQQNLDFDKEKTNLQRRLADDLEAELNRQMAVFDAEQNMLASANKKYAKKTFRDSDIDQSAMDAVKARYAALQEDLTKSQQKAEADRLQSAKESFNAYLQEFGTYQQKREAIATDYDTRIAAAANAGDRMMLEAQKNKALSDLDYQQWIDSEEIALAFSDISNLSQQTISRLIEDMEKYREKVVATFDPDKIEKYEEALNNLRMADAENTFSAFGSMVPEYFTKRLAIQKQINDEAQIGLELTRKQNELSMRTEAQKGAVKIQAKAAGYSISDEDLADPAKVQQIADKVAVAAASGNKFSAALHSALLELLKLNGESAELEKATQKWDGNFAHLKETLDNLDGEEKFRAISEAVGSAAGLIGNLASLASEMADAMGAGGLSKSLGTLGEAMGSVQNIASGFAQGGLVGGIAAAAGEVMKWTTKLFMAGDAKHQKNIERLQEQIDALGKSYEKVGKAADKAFSTDASKLINQQNTLLKQQQALIRQQMAEEEAKKKTDKDKIKEYQERLEEINELLEENAEKAKEAINGTDIKSVISEFASLYAGAWDDGTDAAQKSMQAVKSIISGALTELLKKNIQPAAQNFYDTLAKAMEDGILTDAELANLDTIKAQMDALAASGEEQYKKIQERYKDLDELREELTDISFDSVRDNFKSLLLDMESTTEDFTDSFTDMIRNGLINGLMDNKYDKMLKEWYDEFAEAMNDQTLTNSERDALRQQYDAIVQQGIADRNAVNAIVGGGAFSQQASSGSAWNISQETGEELNGRFTAMVELQATNNVLVSDGNAIAREILVTLRSMSGLSMTVTGNGDNETLLAIKDMMFLSTGYLEDIAKYSKLLADISSNLSEVKSAVKDL